jgi:hypothetical protein
MLLLMVWMGKTLDTKAPIRIERRQSEPVRVVPTRTPEEQAAREEAAMRAALTSRASRYVARAAAQVYPPEEASRANCTFIGASLVHRDGPTAFWDAAFSCADSSVPGALPNPTSVSVRLRQAGPEDWLPDE